LVFIIISPLSNAELSIDKMLWDAKILLKEDYSLNKKATSMVALGNPISSQTL
jgi:hypothetical protein